MARAGGPIPEPAKVAIIQALACFDTPSTVAATIKTDFGLTISLQAIESHDPTKRAGRRLAKRWRELFEETRAKFKEDTSSIAISHRATRLRALDRMAAAAEKRGNLVLAAKLIEQAAREVGGSFTNKVDVSNTDGSLRENNMDEVARAARLAALAAAFNKAQGGDDAAD
ncbi:hypothetical protein ASE85_02415 [Sphingobium sp. Leaf26]|nr:hypothetical protein ASE85_02415 [Sphingobium sp. Leaf26]